ncbi:MAG: hypothetical protein NTX32_04155 [Candidatus Firestonebacteria bacterium]|nr:hypothetical protein [Candidatus Firestonebacteria bacterium]
MSTIDVLNRLYDGQKSIEETAKMLKLPANEEVVKILDMIKNHRVSAEEGKDLLEAVNTKQPAKGQTQTGGRVKALGVFTLITGILLLLFSVIILPLVIWFTLGSVRMRNTPEAMAYDINTGGILVIATCIMLFLFSILFIIYSIGLIRRKNWGRKMGITVSIIVLVLPLLFIFYYCLSISNHNANMRAVTERELKLVDINNCESTILRIQSALEIYYSEKVAYPDNIMVLIDKGFLQAKDDKDPWGNIYRYSLYDNKSNKRGPKFNYLLGSSGPDGIRDTDDDIESPNRVDDHSFKRVGKRVTIIVK